MTRGIHWFRNDLRLRDNTALIALLERVEAWMPVFVVDPRLLGADGETTPRESFLRDSLRRLDEDLRERGVPLVVREGPPALVLPQLMHETGASLLSFNADTTPFALRRDEEVQRKVERAGGRVLSRTDHTVFRASEIRTRAGGPYAVYTPYKRRWWDRFETEPRRPQPLPRLAPAIPGPSSDSTFLEPAQAPSLTLPTGGEQAARRRLLRFLDGGIARYHEDRDRPDLDGTARLSHHLRFGTLSVRECFERAEEAARADSRLRPGVDKWLDEIVWREFYAGILEENPDVLHQSYRREYREMAWDDDPKRFEAWCEGRTGYPIVDAGMRQLQATGWMHNRVRMIVASFLTKDLLLDWRVGERFFFERLVDGDPASNNGGWQWAASVGTDAQPYFRIFNPTSQGKRWDPEGRYVRRWIPELEKVPDADVHTPWQSLFAADYPTPIVDHAVQRARALERFEAARAS